MRCKYPERDLGQRLDGTICRYMGKPVYVRYRERGELHLYSLASGGRELERTIDPNDPEFDISTVPLGYMQDTTETVVYVSRRPARIYKQGVSVDSLLFTPMSGSRLSHTWVQQSFYNMVIDDYPPLRESINRLSRSEKNLEVAVGRDLALKSKGGIVFVHFKGMEVGFIIPQTNTVSIPSGELAWVVSKHLSGFDWEVN